MEFLKRTTNYNGVLSMYQHILHSDCSSYFSKEEMCFSKNIPQLLHKLFCMYTAH